MSDLPRQALAVIQANLALGHEVFEAVAHVTASEPAAVERLLARMEREFAGYHHRRCDLDCTTPPAFEARLALDGWVAQPLVVMVLEGPLPAPAPAADVREMTDAAGWAALEPRA